MEPKARYGVVTFFVREVDDDARQLRCVRLRAAAKRVAKARPGNSGPRNRYSTPPEHRSTVNS